MGIINIIATNVHQAHATRQPIASATDMLETPWRYESDGDNHNRTYYAYHPHICRIDFPTKRAAKRFVKTMNDYQKSALDREEPGQ